MRLSKPRVRPVLPADWTPEQREALESYEREGRLINIFMTIGNNPKALKAFAGWGGFVRRQTKLSEREKELIILRMGWLCRSGYEWTQHKRLGLAAGLSEVEITRIKSGPAADGWSEKELLLLRLVDDLYDDHFVSDGTWNRLVELSSLESAMDAVYITGHYSQVCMILNTFGVQVEQGANWHPDFRPST